MFAKISVIVPAYNIENYIGRCIESILKQTWKNIQVIVVDDGSTDETGRIVDEYAKKNKKMTVVHKKNGGVTSARIEGVKHATGEYVGFVDGDDIIDSDMYERLIKNAEKHDADISHCGYKMIYPSKVEYYYNTGHFIIQDNITGLQDLISGEFVEPGLCNKLYRRTLFEKLVYGNVMDKSIHNMEDLLMNYYLFKRSKLSVYDDWCPYHYILRKGSAATSKFNQHNIIDPRKVFQIILEKEKHNEYLRNIILSRKISSDINILSIKINKENEQFLKNLQYQVKSEFKDSIHSLLKGDVLSLKMKVLIVWVTFSPKSFRISRTLVQKMKRTYNKFEI